MSIVPLSIALIFIVVLSVVSAFKIKASSSLITRSHTKWTMTAISSTGEVPKSSKRKGQVSNLPVFPTGNEVSITESSHTLTYVKDIDHIIGGELSGTETVKAWEMKNGKVKVKVVLKGGNLVSLQDEAKQEYIWENTAGATYYGAGSNSFPLQRGLILHGGIRVAAVTAEHGLYYDSEWDISFAADSTSSTITLSIADTQTNRDDLNDKFSTGLFSAGNSIPMSKYPVTDAMFTFNITMKNNEDFIHLDACMETFKPSTIAEVWLPQTYPITRDSQIIAKQKLRRNKDLWVYNVMIQNQMNYSVMLPDLVRFPEYTTKPGQVLEYPVKTADESVDMYKPLDWPTGAGGILYDYPRREGIYHAVSFGTGRGIAQVSAADKHYTKMWSWGNPDVFNRDPVNAPLAAGRPKEEYYEPWASGFNTAFFEANDFPLGKHSWKSLIVPIRKGLGIKLTQEQLQAVVEARLDAIGAKDLVE